MTQLQRLDLVGADIVRLVDHATAHAALDVSAIEAGCRSVERLAVLYLFRALQDANAFAGGDQVPVDQLKARLHVTPAYERLFGVLLDMLGDGGYVRISDGTVTLAQPRESNEAACAALRDDILAAHPDRAHLIRLVEQCATQAPAVIGGRTSAVEVLFPGGSSALVEAIYAKDDVSRFFNAVTAQAVETAVRSQIAERPGVRVSVLEIGAGTGGTSLPVLERLSPLTAHVTYDYTDISPALLHVAQSGEAGAHSNVRFRPLNIESDPAAQGFAAGYDIVIAANVLHATRDIAATLAKARKLLRPGGLLVLSEVTRIYQFTTLTFGLMPGWWLFKDAGRLPNSPLLSVAGWRRALATAGFADVRCFTPFADVEQPPQCLVLAACGGEEPPPAAISSEELIRRQLQIIEAQLDLLAGRSRT